MYKGQRRRHQLKCYGSIFVYYKRKQSQRGLKMKFANKKLAIVLVMSMLLAACCFPIYSQAFTNSNSKKSLRYIHLNSYDGNDNNDGLTKETSVKTFDKANL